MEKLNNKHTIRLVSSILFFFILSFSYGQQQQFKGIVMEIESSQPIRSVTIKNLRTSQEVESDKEGNFTISGQINDYLSFTMPGYQTDTAFLYHDGVYRVYMLRDEKTIVINEVVISRFTDSRLDYEIAKAKREGYYAEAGQERGGLRLSLSRLFGKTSKQSRNNLKVLIEEKENRLIDRRFTNTLIASLTPMSAEEIALFREQFRPTVEFMETASDEDLKLYIIDAYSKFKQEN